MDGDPSAPADSTKIFIGITGNGTSADTKTVITHSVSNQSTELP